MVKKGVLFLLLATAMFAAGPVRIIFDTDMGNDVDDVIALAVLHSFESRGEAKLLAVTVSKDNRYAAPFVSLFNQFYGRAEIPLGMVKNGKTPEDGNFIKVVYDLRNADGSPLYPRKVNDPAGLPDAVTLLRRVLAKEADSSVTIVQVGFATNLAQLLDSPPDAASPLPGRELVARKVSQLVLMFGRFPTGPAEYNVKIDVPASQKLVGSWPTPIITSGWEIGNSITYNPNRLATEFPQTHHPLVDSYKAYKPMPYEEQLWDPSAVLYAVRPYAAYFSLSPPGTIHVDEKGVTTFVEASGGKHSYIVVNDAQRAAVREAISGLMSEPARAR